MSKDSILLIITGDIANGNRVTKMIDAAEALRCTKVKNIMHIYAPDDDIIIPS